MAIFTHSAFEEIFSQCTLEHDDGFIFFHSPQRFEAFVRRYGGILTDSSDTMYESDEDERIYIFDEDNRIVVACISEVSTDNGEVRYTYYHKPFESVMEFMRATSVFEDDDVSDSIRSIEDQPQAKISDRLQVLFE